MLQLNNQQWIVVGIIITLFVINLGLMLTPMTVPVLWAINTILLVIGSSLFYVLRNEDMGE